MVAPVVEQRAFAGREPGIPQARDAARIGRYGRFDRDGAECGKVEEALHYWRTAVKILQFPVRDAQARLQLPDQMPIKGVLERARSLRVAPAQLLISRKYFLAYWGGYQKAGRVAQQD
jgi:hypothetical protein